jgi:uncharacterized RmlC-like cupin family protein
VTETSGGSCVVIRGGEAGETRSLQGLVNFVGISVESAGAKRICLHLIVLPPGGRAHAHLHEGHETALYMTSGAVGMWYGPGLEHYVEARAGDFVYIPADMPHLPFNLSDTEGAAAIGARTDPNEQESVVLLPELEAVHAPNA